MDKISYKRLTLSEDIVKNVRGATFLTQPVQHGPRADCHGWAAFISCRHSTSQSRAQLSM